MIPVAIIDKLENPRLTRKADFLLRLPVEPIDSSALTLHICGLVESVAFSL